MQLTLKANLIFSDNMPLQAVRAEISAEPEILVVKVPAGPIILRLKFTYLNGVKNGDKEEKDQGQNQEEHRYQSQGSPQEQGHRHRLRQGQTQPCNEDQDQKDRKIKAKDR